jgi:Bax protein
VPLNRNQGATHEVKVFTSVDESISAYFDNLNTNAAYNDFRSIRLALRNENQTITGKALAEGLIKYSEKGYEYVEMIQSMIASNNLESYDVRLAIKD